MSTSWASRLKTNATTTSTSTSTPSSTSTSTPNGIGKNNPSIPTSTSPTPVQDAGTRTLTYLLSHLRGHVVTVQLRDGTSHEGIFHTAESSDSSLTLILKSVQQCNNTGERNTHPYIHLMRIHSDEMICVKIANLGFGSQYVNNNGGEKKGFQTDTQISNRALTERPLQKWQPDDDTGIGASLDEMASTSTRSWDQFATHEAMTQQKSSFNFDDYSTPLDRTSEFYQQHVARAEQIARDIMNQTSTNVQEALDRGQHVDVDDDELYSTVVRDEDEMRSKPLEPPSSGGKYKIPARRMDGDHESPAAQGKRGKKASINKGVGPSPSPPAASPPPADKKETVTHTPTPAPTTVTPTPAPAAAAPTPTPPPATTTPTPTPTPAPTTTTTTPAPTPATPTPTPTPAASKAEDEPATDAAASTSSSSSTSTSTSTSTDTTKKPVSKLNPKAKAFTLNASAKAFTPGAAVATTTPAATNSPSLTAQQPHHQHGRQHPQHGRGPQQTPPQQQAIPPQAMMPGMQPPFFPTGYMMPQMGGQPMMMYPPMGVPQPFMMAPQMGGPMRMPVPMNVPVTGSPLAVPMNPAMMNAAGAGGTPLPMQPVYVPNPYQNPYQMQPQQQLQQQPQAQQQGGGRRGGGPHQHQQQQQQQQQMMYNNPGFYPAMGAGPQTPKLQAGNSTGSVSSPMHQSQN